MRRYNLHKRKNKNPRCKRWREKLEMSEKEIKVYEKIAEWREKHGQ